MDNTSMENKERIYEFAGFRERFGASLIDAGILLFITTPLLYWIYGGAYWTSGEAIMGFADFIISIVFPFVEIGNKVAFARNRRMHVQRHFDRRFRGHKFCESVSKHGHFRLYRICVPITLNVDAVSILTREFQFHSVGIVHGNDVKNSFFTNEPGKFIFREQQLNQFLGNPIALYFSRVGAHMNEYRSLILCRRCVRGDGQLPQGSILHTGSQRIHGHVRTLPPAD